MTADPTTLGDPIPVDDDLKQALHRRADAVEASADAWPAITRRIERRQRRTRTLSLSLVAGMSFGAVALVAVLTTFVGNDPADQNVAATGGADLNRSTTTLLATIETPAAAAASASTVPGQAAAPASGSDPTVPGARPPGAITTREYTPEAVWPETIEELGRAQDAADQGLQPWRYDPAAVAAAYLADRGIGTFHQAEPVGDANPVVRYIVGGYDGGHIYLSRYRGGSTFYVVGSRSDEISEVHAVRQGDRLAVDVTAAGPGRVAVRTKQPGSDWNESASHTVVADQPVSLTIDGSSSSALIVQVRLEADSGVLSLSEQYLGASILGFDDEKLHNGSNLRFGGVGPIQLDMTLAEAEQAAGITTITNVGEHCTTLGSTGRVGGLLILSMNGSGRIDVITVSEGNVRTDAGIGVGSTVAEVRTTYPGIEERLTDGWGRLVLRPSDPQLSGYEMVFEVAEGEVVGMWSGRKDLGNSDELCA